MSGRRRARRPAVMRCARPRPGRRPPATSARRARRRRRSPSATRSGHELGHVVARRARRTAACPPPSRSRRPPGRPAPRAARRHQLAAVDDRDAVADELDLGEQVRVEQHRDAAAAQLDEQLAHVAPAGRVQRAGRLVEQQQPRAGRRAPARSRAAAASPWTSSPSAAARRRCSPTSVEQLGALARAALRCRPGAGAASAPRRPSTSRGSGTARRGSRAPGARGAARPARRRPRRVPPVGRTRPTGDLHERRLARAVGAQQPDELARRRPRRSTPRRASTPPR